MEEKNKRVIILVGLPGSGKTTWALEYIRKHPNTVRVGRDSFRYMLRNEGKCEVKVESMINELIENAILTALKYGMDVIVDNTNLKASKINEIIRLVEYNADVCFQVFNVPAKTCIERDKLRDKGVGENAINELNEDWKVISDSFVFQDTKRKPEWKRNKIKYVFEHDQYPTCVIFDIDGNIAELYNREPYDWDKVDRDKPIPLVVEQIKFHRAAGRFIVLVSGRDEECRKMTMDWLEFYEIPYDELHMRPLGSWDKDTKVKRDIYFEKIEPKYNTLCVYDDRLSVVKMWHKLGLFVFCTNPGLIDF